MSFAVIVLIGNTQLPIQVSPCSALLSSLQLWLPCSLFEHVSCSHECPTCCLSDGEAPNGWKPAKTWGFLPSLLTSQQTATAREYSAKKSTAKESKLRDFLNISKKWIIIRAVKTEKRNHPFSKKTNQVDNPFVRSSSEPAPGLWHTFSIDLAVVLSCLLHLVELSLLPPPSPTQQYWHGVPSICYLCAAPLYQKHPSALAETLRMALGSKFICEPAKQKIFWLFVLGKLNIFKKALMQTVWGWKKAYIWSWKLIVLVQKLKDLLIDFLKRYIL